MAETGRGYKAAAKHFTMPVAEVRKLCKAPTKKPSRTRAREKAAAELADMTLDGIDTNWAEQTEQEFYAFAVNEMLRKSQDAHGIAAKDYMLAAMNARKMLDACRPKETTSDLTKDQRQAFLQRWTDEWLAEASWELANRYGARFVLVNESGQQQELTDQGWLQVLGG